MAFFNHAGKQKLSTGRAGRGWISLGDANSSIPTWVLIKTARLSDLSGRVWSPQSHLLPTRACSDSSPAGRQLSELGVIPEAQFDPFSNGVTDFDLKQSQKEEYGSREMKVNQVCFKPLTCTALTPARRIYTCSHSVIARGKAALT